MEDRKVNTLSHLLNDAQDFGVRGHIHAVKLMLSKFPNVVYQIWQKKITIIKPIIYVFGSFPQKSSPGISRIWQANCMPMVYLWECIFMMLTCTLINTILIRKHSKLYFNDTVWNEVATPIPTWGQQSTIYCHLVYTPTGYNQGGKKYTEKERKHERSEGGKSRAQFSQLRKYAATTCSFSSSSSLKRK